MGRDFSTARERAATGVPPPPLASARLVPSFPVSGGSAREIRGTPKHRRTVPPGARALVAVQNGTDVPGVAKQVADLLKERGFDAKSAGNAPHRTSGEAGTENGEVTETQVVYGKAAVAARAQKIAQMIGGGKVTKEVKPAPADTDEPDADVTVVLGRDLAPSFVKRSAQK